MWIGLKGLLVFPALKTKRQLRVFLGLAGYCRKWIPNFFLIAQPLYKLLERDQAEPLYWKVEHSEGDQPWDFFGRNDVKAETPILWPSHVKSWLIGKDSDAGRDWGQDDRGWDGWMASPTQWTWVWVNSGSWWWTGRPSVLQFMGAQRVGHGWATELNWTHIYGI